MIVDNFGFEFEDNILNSYEVQNNTGKSLFKAVDKETEKLVLIKRKSEAFKCSTASQKTYREILILQELRGYEGIVQLLDVILSKNEEDVYLILDYMDSDLLTALCKKILTPTANGFVVYQLLRVLRSLNSSGIIYRDLNPSNVLIDADVNIKLCHFDYARCVDNHIGAMTDYVGKRWYQAPELLLGNYLL